MYYGWTDKLGDYQRMYHEPAAQISWVRILRPSTGTTISRQFRNFVTPAEVANWINSEFPGWILLQAW